ncbi:tRNA synthetases class II-domain-containing protein [Scheffersomyces amazonensis]|uniref:tRNA synthetases class II-domain-containing protein n=1 Tax=Scheffersomyces amazonensis TaxID=1078765 RepID=UPI00315DF1C9
MIGYIRCIRPSYRHVYRSAWRYNSTGVSSLPGKELTIAKFDFPLASHSIDQVYQDLDTILNAQTPVRVTLTGHVNRKPRIRPNLAFAELRDSQGDTIQLIMNPDTTESKYFELMKSTKIEDSISVTGIVKLKEVRGDVPSDRKEWELLIDHYQILNSSNLDAARLDKLKHSDPGAIPPQFRYLTLRNNNYQRIFRMRSKIAQMIRNIFIDNHDFVEIETPLLFKSTPEGAREFLVPTRAIDRFYALPQSPQQYKQILMSSGFTKYFQLAKCFRDEDLRQDRQPEFTQVDMEMSYINNSDQVCHVVEDIIHNVVNKFANKPTYTINRFNNCLEKIPFDTQKKLEGIKFIKMKYIDCLTDYGIDKPDFRYDYKLTNLSKFFKPSSTTTEGFPIVEALVVKNVTDSTNNYKVPHSLAETKDYSRRAPYIFSIKTEDDRRNWFKKFVEKGVLSVTDQFNNEELSSLLNLEIGDVFAFSTRAEFPYENPTPMGRFRQFVIESFPEKGKRKIYDPQTQLISENSIPHNDIFVGTWVVDFPLFNPIELDSEDKSYPVYDFNKFESTHHPFTMAKTADYDLLQYDPLKVRGEHYDLVMNGSEVGGGSRRVHDPELQKYIFERILRINNYEDKFGHLLKALSMGCPPHAGLALGFDRLVAMLVGTANLRDVIAFPKNQSGVDPVVDSPTSVSKDVLKQYHVITINE